MGRHLDRYEKSQKETVKEKNIKPFKIKEDKSFKELVEKVGVLELALNDLVEKIKVLETKDAPVEE